MSSLTRSEVLRATTRVPWTKHFRHLLPVPKPWQVRQSRFFPGIKAVPVKNRIKHWNVVPGDKIRIRGEGSKLHEVMSINKFTNRVYLKGASREVGPRKTPVNRSVHYSRCQLFLGTFKIPRPQGREKDVDVFAQRVGVRDPFWHPGLRRFDWKRIALATIPAHYKKTTTKGQIVIPWPKEEIPERPAANQFYDTTEEAVLKITYQPPNLQKPIPADESAYISTLFSPQPRAFDESTPMEFHLAKELSNPHSRAKKQGRWQAAKARRADLLKKFVEKELMQLNGRSATAARAEGVFKFRQKVEEERKAEKKRRWFTAERLEKIERKVKRKQRKEQKQKEKLTQLVLRDAPNQVIPAAGPSKRK